MAPQMLPGRGSSLPLVVDTSYLPVNGNSGSVELKSEAQARVPEGNLVSLCEGWGDPLTFHSLSSRGSGMSRGTQSSPISTWPGGQHAEHPEWPLEYLL